MSKSQSIHVICRIRPENEREKASGMKGCIDILSENTLKIYPIDIPTKSSQVTKEEPHEFTFDRVFPDTTRQIEVFEFAAKPLIDGIFEGINCTLFCYGQKNQINENKTQNLIKKYENFKVENDLKVSIEYREIVNISLIYYLKHLKTKI